MADQVRVQKVKHRLNVAISIPTYETCAIWCRDNAIPFVCCFEMKGEGYPRVYRTSRDAIRIRNKMLANHVGECALTHPTMRFPVIIKLYASPGDRALFKIMFGF